MPTEPVYAKATPAEVQQRTAALRAMAVLDTPDEDAYDALTRLAAIVCETPIALVSLIDGPRLWFKAAHGVGVKEIDSECSFCCESANLKAALEVCDARLDARFRGNALVTGTLGIQYYAAAPIMHNDIAIGTVCVLDYVPRKLARAPLMALGEMATLAGNLLTARIDVFRLLSTVRPAAGEQGGNDGA